MYKNEHEIVETTQIIDVSKDFSRSPNYKQQDKSVLNNTHKNYMYWKTCWKCGEFGHLPKTCDIPSLNRNQFNNVQDQATVNMCRNAQSGSPIPLTIGQIKCPP